MAVTLYTQPCFQVVKHSSKFVNQTLVTWAVNVTYCPSHAIKGHSRLGTLWISFKSLFHKVKIWEMAVKEKWKISEICCKATYEASFRYWFKINVNNAEIFLTMSDQFPHDILLYITKITITTVLISTSLLLSGLTGWGSKNLWKT